MVRQNQRNKRAFKESQAISDDFTDTGYDRGHLNPNLFQCGVGRTATFTLTNVAPMDACFNRNQWGAWEKNLRTFLLEMLRADNGQATVYVVTGTVPNENLRIPQKEISEESEEESKESERVTVPSHIWKAVCYKHNLFEEKSFSFGYIGENKPEGGISLMRVSDLNREITNLYDRFSEISIFVDACFGDNNRFDKAKGQFQILINLAVNQNVQMSSGIQNTYLTLKRAVSSDNTPEKKFKVSEMTTKLAFDTMSDYFREADDLKAIAGVPCLITHAKPIARYNINKRDISGTSDAVECLLTPQKQKTAADGSACSRISDSTYNCLCYIGDEHKSCCSSTCRYQDTSNGYRCYSGQTLIECSPHYSLITHTGERCLDDHPCATYGRDYYWCKTISGSSDYCSPPLLKSKTKSGKYCRSNHACAKYGTSYKWCYTDDQNNYDYCCICNDNALTVNGQTCRYNHYCHYHGEDYLWCYTDFNNNWDYCTNCNC